MVLRPPRPTQTDPSAPVPTRTCSGSFEFIYGHSGSFGLFKHIWAFLCPFNLDSCQPIQYILEEITLIYILLILCKCSHPLAVYEKNPQTYQYLFYDYHLVYILATVWDTSTSISNSAVFLHIVLDPLKQRRPDFSQPKKTFVRIQLLEIKCWKSFYSDIICCKRE